MKYFVSLKGQIQNV